MIALAVVKGAAIVAPGTGRGASTSTCEPPMPGAPSWTETLDVLPAWIPAGLLAAGAVLVALALLGRGARRQARRTETLAREVEALRAELRTLCAAQAGLVRHLETLEGRCRQLGERLDRMDLREAGEAAYGHALRLARRGAPVEELVAQCGLSRGEAELLLRLHGSGAAHQRRAAAG